MGLDAKSKNGCGWTPFDVEALRSVAQYRMAHYVVEA